MLRAGLGTRQEHLVNQDAQAADTKVPAEVIHAAFHEVDSDSGNDESIIATSDSEESGSESDTIQNDSSSSLASDSEQYELMQTAYAAVGRDFENKGEFIGQNITSSGDWSWSLNGGPLQDFPFPAKVRGSS